MTTLDEVAYLFVLECSLDHFENRAVERLALSAPTARDAVEPVRKLLRNGGCGGVLPDGRMFYIEWNDVRIKIRLGDSIFGIPYHELVAYARRNVAEDQQLALF